MEHARRIPRTILPALVAAMLGLAATFAPTGARAQFASDGVYPLSYSDWCVVDDPSAATFVEYGNFYDHSYGNWLHAPEVVNVYWPGDQPHDPLVHSLMGDFVTDFFASEEWNLVMPQYFTPAFEGDAPAVYLSSHDITLLTVPPGTTTVTDAQIGAELSAQMKAGNLPFTLRSYPEPGGHIETLYVVHMPPGVVVQQRPDLFQSDSCVDFCAYHSWGKYDPHEVCVPYFLGGEICQLEWTPFAYALMPDFSQSACGTLCGRGTPFERYTESLDHELVEAITVPFASAGWRNQCGVGDELSDVCEGSLGVDFQTPRHTYSDGAPQCPNRWARTPVWSIEDHGCVVAGSTTDTFCVEPYCGDGVVTANVHEQCDDGDTVAGDGCSPSCTVESGFDCSGAPSVCALRTALETKAQQGCINALNKAGAAVVKAQGKVVGSCLKAAANGTTGSLGTPSQAQTAEACLTNDVQGMVAKSVAGLEAKEAKACLETPAEQQPDYAYTGAAATGAAATGAALSLEAKLFGASLDAALVAVASDKPGALCQQEVQKRTQVLVDTLWKLALGAKKTALKGSRTVAPVDDVVKLRQAIVSTLQADANQTLAKSVATLGQKVDDRCASLALPALFPGACASASTAASLASCATTAARCAFCRSLALSDGFGLDCDAFDDGAANGSCS